MKLLPGFSTFDDVFNNMFNDSFLKSTSNYMRTDVKEVDNNYVLEMELAGFNKEDISIELHEGYLTITGNKSSNVDKKIMMEILFVKKDILDLAAVVFM